MDNKKKIYLLEELARLHASCVAIHYEDTSETSEFVEQVFLFLRENNFEVITHRRTISGMPREFFFVEPSAEPGWAYLRIGSLI